MDSHHIRPYVYGERPLDAAPVAVSVALVSAVTFAALGSVGVSVDTSPGEVVFLAVFSILPIAAGAICGYRSFGFPAATVCGVIPAVTFYVVVTVGTALGVGSFGGGDSPAWALGIAFGSVGFIWSVFGFAVGVGVALSRR